MLILVRACIEKMVFTSLAPALFNRSRYDASSAFNSVTPSKHSNNPKKTLLNIRKNLPRRITGKEQPAKTAETKPVQAQIHGAQLKIPVSNNSDSSRPIAMAIFCISFSRFYNLLSSYHLHANGSRHVISG
jgi:hypothetical protein